MKRHDHDRGLAHDLTTMARGLSGAMDRRRALQLLGGVTLLPLIGCGSDMLSVLDSGAGGDLANGGNPDLATGGGSCTVIPEETEGPYPGDGSNGANALTQTGIVRSDIRTSFAGMSGTAAGIPLTIALSLVNTKAKCAALAGYAIYLWHCDRDGVYSLYTVANQNYLRGVQETDASGTVKFTSIFPACYSGRWPHIHFEIYPSLAKATTAGNKIKTSQLALPESDCNAVFATAGYEKSVQNLAMTSLAKDMVFSDGSTTQIATVTGNVAGGYQASLTVGVAV